MKKYLLFYSLMLITIGSSLVFYANAENAEKQQNLESIPKQVVPLPTDWLDTTPVHNDRKLLFYLNEFAYRCKECHRDFNTVIRSHLPFGAHKDMVFSHGLNLRCYNCHNFKNLETYIDHDGSEIPNNKPVLLCRKCHGTTYRDWVAGVHGRTNGYWNDSRGTQIKLECNQCHNPHQPHFPHLVPRPSPSQASIPHFEKEKGKHHE